ncbi:MAG: hypothetical protein JEZ00_18025 [Anaerolineaceae bacterium]|nr:hypothetical protein [Anaerolineaceae bacterium]
MSSKWSSAYLTGIKEIDEHHFTIIKKLYEIGQLINLPHAKSEIMDALLFLESYTSMHFKAEEQVMAEKNCTAAEINKKQHAVFIKYVHALNQKFAQNDTMDVNLSDIEKELTDWVLNHIMEVDLKLKGEESLN